jgi:ketosteroid isomerase-like protein
MIDNRANEVLAVETERCAAIRAQDFDKLRMLLHPSLVHFHARGNQDGRESYMKYLAQVVEILDVRRGDLSVSVYRDCAVMTGRQYNTARARGAEPVLTIEAQVMQVWLREEETWRQVAFQATPIGDPPPPIPAVGASK